LATRKTKNTCEDIYPRFCIPESLSIHRDGTTLRPETVHEWTNEKRRASKPGGAAFKRFSADC
jgi:hypothetical protein